MNRRLAAVAVALFVTMAAATGWAYWGTSSITGGNGSAAASSVNQGATPSATAVARKVTVNWSSVTLTDGRVVNGYEVRRYEADTLIAQTVLAGCTGVVTVTTCTENNVPPGRWVYSVTPLFATNWRGPESVKSTPVTVEAASLSLAATRIKPGTSVTGTVAGFSGGESLRYRLGSTSGTELSGTLGGVATPAIVPAGGGGAVSVTVPSGTTDGTHTLHAVASPSGDAAAATIVVDGTAPPVPVLTVTPTAVSGDSVTFAYTEAEATATVECSLDGAAFSSCSSPVDYFALTSGSHTFQARAVDTVGNVSAAASYTWTVNLSIPTISIASPAVAGIYNDSGFDAGCGTPSAGDICGTADDDAGVAAVNISIRRVSTGLYWTGLGFVGATETWLLALGTNDWNYPILSSALPEGQFLLRARASDGSNLGYDSRTFTVDRTAPGAPTMTAVPPATSGPSVTFGFTSTDPTAAFQCRLDAGAWVSCSSPHPYANLSHGSHTVAVRAVDGAGNASSNTTTTWTVDATAPSVAMSFPTANRFNLAGWAAGCGTAAGDICGTASDVGSGLTTVAVSIRRNATSSYWDGVSFGAASEAWLTATGTGTWSYPFSGAGFPADGTYTVRWRAIDAVGNETVQGVEIVLDSTAPTAPQIVHAPSNPGGPSAQFNFTAESGAATECRLDSGSWTSCTAPVSYDGLPEGPHSFGVRAIDAAGNVGPIASHSWTVDTSLPTVHIDFPGGGGFYNNATYAAGCGSPGGDICGTAEDLQGQLDRVEVSIQQSSTSLYWNGSSFSSTTEVLLPTTGSSNWSYAMAAAAFPADGNYTLRAVATDTGGLSASDTVIIHMDRTAPGAPTITSGPTGTTSGNDTFTFIGETGADFECRIDAGAWAGCSSPTTYGVLVDGSHVFAVRAVDRAGNAGALASRTWTTDRSGPTVGGLFPVSGSRYSDTTFTAGCVAGTGDICGTAADSGSGVSKVEVSLRRGSTGLYLSGTTFGSANQTWLAATGTTSWSYLIAATTFPADDTYTLSIRATDNVGNVSTTTSSFVIDRTRPTAIGFTTTNYLTAGRLEARDTFTLTYSEAIAPSSVIAGWTGTTTQNVVVRASGSGGNKDRLVIYNATNTTLLPLGTINLKRTDFVSSAMTFGLTGTPSTITMSGSSFTITLGTPSGTTTQALGTANVSWTPSTGTTDVAGNPTSTTIYTENDLDLDF